VPNYEFRCKECKRVFEVRQSVEEHGRKPPACSHCGSKRVEAVFSTFYAQTSRKS
jgi:putative FmdB family regulatory protein